MKKLEKKQVPQVVILVVLSVALFGYFAKTMILPSPASAKSAPPAAVAMATVPLAPATAATQTTAAVPATSETPAPDADVTAPPPAMRDPFAQAIAKPAASAPAFPAAPATRVAALPTLSPGGIAVPSAPMLPFPAMGIREPGRAGAGALPPLPVAPPWTVTGVLQSGGERIVILRSGEARRIVKQGDFVDSDFQVAKVTRTAVVLRSAQATFTLPLGGPKTPTAAKTVPGVTNFPTQPAALTAPLPSLLPTPRMVPPAVRPDVSRARTAHPHIAFAAPRELPASLFKPTLIKPVVKVADSRSEWNKSLKTELPGINWNAALKIHAARRAPSVKVQVRENAPTLAVLNTASVKAYAPKPVALMSIFNPVASVPVEVRQVRPAVTLKAHMPRLAVHLKVHVRNLANAVAVFDPQDAVPMAGMPTTGTLAPPWTLPTLSGPPVSLSDLHGRVVVLNFWASWVPGCFQEMSSLRTLQSALGGRGLSILNINSWDTADAAAAMLNRLPALAGTRLYDELFDPGVSNESVAVSLYHAPDVPTLYVLDRDGTIAAAFVGCNERTLAALKQALKSLGVF